MNSSLYTDLSKRERQIMDILFRLKRAGAAEIRKRMPDEPAYNSVRVLLSILEEKGHVTHEKEGQRYIYRPTQSEDGVKQSALKHLVTTFFEGSASKAMTTLLNHSGTDLSDEELERLSLLIERAKQQRQQ